jgi:hypothetical protein
MLLAPKFLNYEQPKGVPEGKPDLILVRKSLVNQLGLPTLNYDNLAREYQDGLGFSSGKMPIAYAEPCPNPSNIFNPERLIWHSGKQSFRMGREIHAKLSPLTPQEVNATRLDTEHFMRQVLYGAAAYSIAKGNERHIRNSDIAFNAAAVAVPSGATAALAGGEPGLVVGGVVGVGVLASLARTRSERINDEAYRVSEEIAEAHINDLVFPKQ